MNEVNFDTVLVIKNASELVVTAVNNTSHVVKYRVLESIRAASKLENYEALY